MMLMRDKLKQLEETTYEDPKKVFSMYLNTDPRDPEQSEKKWKITFKKALDDLAEQTKDSDSHEEKNQAKEVREKVEKEIYDKKDQLNRSTLLFATADEDLWYSFSLNIAVESEFHWDRSPDVRQLRDLIDRYPYTGIL